MSSPPPYDELSRAVERLQAFAREVPGEAAATRARVLASEHASRTLRGRVAWIAAGAIALLGGPAFAHFTGIVDLAPAWLSPARPDTDRDKPARRAQERRGDQEVTVQEAPPAISEPVATPPVEPVAQPEAKAQPRAARPATSAPKSAPTTPVDTRALYRSAHAAHFGGSDPEVALRAWDAFLAAAPGDAFAPEARYNRAILLVKLERNAQAIEALAPFACAASGAYRQREASALLERVRRRAPSLQVPACVKAAP